MYILGVFLGFILLVVFMILGGYILGFESVNLMSIFVVVFIGVLIVMFIVILFVNKVKNIIIFLIIGIMIGYVCSGIINVL